MTTDSFAMRRKRHRASAAQEPYRPILIFGFQETAAEKPPSI